MSLPTPAIDALRVYLRRVMDPDDFVEAERMLDAAIRADRMRVLDACREEVRLAVYNKGAHRSVGYCLGKLRVRLDAMRREIEQP